MPWHWHLLGFWEGYMSIFSEAAKYALGLATSFGALYGIIFTINSHCCPAILLGA